MDQRLERLFEFREEYQMEVDKALKVQLLKQMRVEIERFLKESDLHMTAWDFLHATSEAYLQWRRNKH